MNLTLRNLIQRRQTAQAAASDAAVDAAVALQREIRATIRNNARMQGSIADWAALLLVQLRTSGFDADAEFALERMVVSLRGCAVDAAKLAEQYSE